VLKNNMPLCFLLAGIAGIVFSFLSFFPLLSFRSPSTLPCGWSCVEGRCKNQAKYRPGDCAVVHCFASHGPMVAHLRVPNPYSYQSSITAQQGLRRHSHARRTRSEALKISP
jgi:hypothetical protein